MFLLFGTGLVRDPAYIVGGSNKSGYVRFGEIMLGCVSSDEVRPYF